MLGPRLGMLVCAAAAMAGGCSAYDFHWVYEAAPGVPEARLEEGGVGTTVTVLGVRRPASGGTPAGGATVEVTVMVRNDGPTQVSLDPAAVELADAAGRALPEPAASVAGVMTILPGAMASVTLSAGFPGGADAAGFDLERLLVRVPLRVDGAAIERRAVFERQPNEYYERYPKRLGTGFRRIDMPPG